MKPSLLNQFRVRQLTVHTGVRGDHQLWRRGEMSLFLLAVPPFSQKNGSNGDQTIEQSAKECTHSWFAQMPYVGNHSMNSIFFATCDCKLVLNMGYDWFNLGLLGTHLKSGIGGSVIRLVRTWRPSLQSRTSFAALADSRISLFPPTENRTLVEIIDLFLSQSICANEKCVHLFAPYTVVSSPLSPFFAIEAEQPQKIRKISSPRRSWESPLTSVCTVRWRVLNWFSRDCFILASLRHLAQCVHCFEQTTVAATFGRTNGVFQTS